MRKIALSTVASYTFFYMLLAPVLILVMFVGLNNALESPSLYLKITVSFIFMYIVFACVPTGFNILWKSFKVKHPKRILILLAFFIVFTISFLLGAVSSINVFLGLFSVLYRQ
ncbi:hypothetical protein D7X33_32060 [Butyricicoccus sp. 1XD8-22]|nr:hypothetical protein D7X33_32060 [Butyricicoccus sp. 1XD8-22]